MELTVTHPTDRPNYCMTRIGDLTVFFSYQTPIAFFNPATGDHAARVNEWGPTTARHFHEAGFGVSSGRIPGDEFMARLTAALQRVATQHQQEVTS